MGCKGSKAEATPEPQEQQQAANATLLAPEGKAKTDKVCVEGSTDPEPTSTISDVMVDNADSPAAANWLATIEESEPEEPEIESEPQLSAAANCTATAEKSEPETPEIQSELQSPAAENCTAAAEKSEPEKPEVQSESQSLPAASGTATAEKSEPEKPEIQSESQSSPAANGTATAEKLEPEKPEIQSESQEPNDRAVPGIAEVESVRAPSSGQQNRNFSCMRFCQSTESETEIVVRSD